MSSLRPFVFVCLITAVCNPLAFAQSADSLVTKIQGMISECDSLVYEVTYLTTVRERELRDDGAVKSEKIYESRHFVRDKDTREILEAMWEDGEQVEPSKLASEQKKRDKERAKQRKARVDKRSDDDGGSRSQEMLGPLRPEHIANYTFPEVTAEDVDGIACWKLAVKPVRDDEDLVKGFIWVEQGSDRAVAEQYELSKRPGALKEFGIRMDYDTMLERCAMVRRVHVHGKGKALLIIKFNFDVELLIDSVQVNPGLPDSLFTESFDE